jgi:hypothetical protein
MIIHNPILTGSFTVNGTDVSSITSSAASLTSLNAYTASQNNRNGTYATTGSNTFAGIQTVNSNLVVTGSITAQTLVVQTVTSSVVYSSGSNVFGNNIANTQVFTGSMNLTGSLTVITTGTEFQVTNTGVRIGNVIGDAHNITGSVGVSGSATFVSSIAANGIMSLGDDGTYGSTYKTLGFTGNTNGTHRIFAGTADDMYIAAATARGIYFWTDGSSGTKMRILANGNVGIGTSSPVDAGVSSRTLQLLNTVILQNVVGTQALFSNNAYYDGTWKRATALGAAAVRMNTDSGQTGISFHVGPTGTAGSSITNWDTTDIKMRINENGNVGIGTMTPSNLFHVQGVARITSGIYLNNTGSGTGAFIWQEASEPLRFATSDTERMRITATGQTNFLHSQTNQDVIYATNGSASPYGMNITFTAASPNNTTNNFIYLADSSGLKCRIVSNGSIYNSTGTYGTISDIKFKENIIDATPKLDDLLKLKVRNFNLIGDETKQIGFVAQEFEEVFPNMVDNSKDKETGDEYKAIKMSILIPILVKAIQELQAQITELKNK